MPPGSPSSGRTRRFFKRIGYGVQKVFKSGDQTPSSRTASPPLVSPSGPSPQAPSSLEPILVPSPQAPIQSPQPNILLQPEPNPSQPVLTTSVLYSDSNQPTNVESSLTAAAKKAGADAWTGLKVSLRLLEKSSDVFPPVKSAVAGFLGVVDIFETAAQNRRDYVELASNLQGLVEDFKEHPGEHTSSKMSEALAAMASGLEKEMKHVEEQRQRLGVRRHLEAGQDVGDVQGCYRRVETLCRELQNKALLDIWKSQERQRVLQEEQKVDARLKELDAALGAMYDSNLADVVGRRTCTPGTREAILAEMRSWADDPKSPNVYWLNGMAGTGKTTLAYSFCAEMKLEHRLGASFFCSRTDADSRDVSKIVPTIAHQLARLLPSYREALIQQMSEDKEIGVRRTETQFEKLIRGPLGEVGASVPEGIVITIDALDECDRRDGARDILNTLFLHARDLPVKFFVTCRPDPGLFDTLQSKDERYRSVLHLHDIERSFVQADIRKYLEVELAETSLAPDKLRMLAEQAGTLFIYAATAVRYIHPQNRQVNVHQRLEDLLSIVSKARTNKHKGIDELYAAVLAAPFADEELNPQEQKNIRLVLDTAVCAREPMSAATMAKLLELDGEQDVICALQHLRSVLHVSQGADLISTLHASFPDFMLDRERSKNLCCDVVEHNSLLALCCFNAMHRLLKFNICELDSSFALDKDIPGLTRKIEKAISPELLYACRYWGAHVEFAIALDSVESALEGFLSNRLLFWMEVLNLKNCISTGAQMLTDIHTWLQRSGGANDVLELALDAGRFVTAFGLSPASRSTPHIYISALPFWPETRPIRARYWKRTQGLIRLEGLGMKERDLSCLAMWDAASSVYAVALSPDGTRIASVSGDNTVRVWDAHTGGPVAGPFKGHTSQVSSVAFSPDGTRIVSGSWDKTIRVWDTISGDLVAEPFEGHTDRVSSVAFSLDGTRIVSGSHDQTIRVWDARSGDLVAGPFTRFNGKVIAVALSPDGTLIASGSWDTIRVWDAVSGGLVAGPFEGHTERVTSVAFSPDGTRIVSSSWDKTIRVWDAVSGNLVAGPFKGHTDRVSSVAFSPNGTRIVSGSEDGTIRVWDAHSGNPVAEPFEGHTDQVSSVVFSPDGTRIISGSWDSTIRVWDARSGDFVAGSFKGHTSQVSSVAFSPDGARIVSGSWDNTVRVWDTIDGSLVAEPFEGHTDQVTSIAFSSDGTRIVSGSHDHNICVWDAVSGGLIAGPFKGHASAVASVAFSPDSTCIVSGSWDNTIRVWGAHNGESVAGSFEGHTERVNSVAFSPDGTRIVSGSGDYAIRVWDAVSGDLVAEPFVGHTGAVSSVAFSPDSTRIVSGSHDQTIRVWDAGSGDLAVVPFKGHTDRVSSVAFSPDGTRIVSGSHDQTIRVWDAVSGGLVAGPFRGHTDRVSSVAFSPDGTCVVSGSNDKSVRIWTAAPLYAHDHGHLKNWRMDRTGTITTRQGHLLLCVPPDLWVKVVRPENTVCIYYKGVIRLDFDDVVLGNQWMQCYQT